MGCFDMPKISGMPSLFLASHILLVLVNKMNAMTITETIISIVDIKTDLYTPTQSSLTRIIHRNSINLNTTFQPSPYSIFSDLNGTFHFDISPPSINDLLVNSNQTVNFSCNVDHQFPNVLNDSIGNRNLIQNNDHLNTSLLVTVTSSDHNVASIVSYRMVQGRKRLVRTPILQETISMQVELNNDHNFTIEAMKIGYVTFLLTLLESESIDMAKAGYSKQLSSTEYNVQVVRAEKLADFVFDCSAAAVAILISFGIGCVTDTDSIKKQLKYPVSLLIGFCCQFLLMPVLAFGIAKILNLERNVQFGLLCVACVPGGGFGHVAVIVSKSDLPLSVTMNLINIVAMLGTAPLWIFVLGQYFQSNQGIRIIPIYNFEIWLASIFFAYTAGLVINRFKPVVADALMTWIIKPFLLLATILYITLGVYINMYVFDPVDGWAFFAALLLPLCGFIMAYVLGIIFRQKTSFCQSLALETSSLNCLIVLAAIRFTLQKPAADLASTIPIWTMFTIPGLYVVLSILNYIKCSLCSFCKSRKEEKFRHFSIASGIVNQANMAALSAPLFVTEVTDDEQASMSEKITVL
ncbi:uncharacterized protein LOC134681638 isoform X2 [Mytilus trossulus]|uniref:uncharacterized protein LOC134681638 isoform X2 n=1 Tax=Mytilus trossulus TaxID=6551 RepID=UPI003005B1F4